MPYICRAPIRTKFPLQKKSGNFVRIFIISLAVFHQGFRGFILEHRLIDSCFTMLFTLIAYDFTLLCLFFTILSVFALFWLWLINQPEGKRIYVS